MNAGNWMVHNGQWVLVPCGSKETVSGNVHYWECRLPTQEEFMSAAYRAKKKGIPVAPRRLEDLAFSLLNTDSRNMENYI